MARLAIIGHPTRGKEVIEILEMFGGKNHTHLNGDSTDCVYYNYTEGCIDTRYYVSIADYKVFTLEDFLEKFPYKLGDKVIWKFDKDKTQRTITRMSWDGNSDVAYWLDCEGSSFGWCDVNELEPYKEEKTMNTNVAEVRERIVLPAGKDKMEIVTNDDCEFVSDGGKFYVRRKKVVFPETYEECLELIETPDIICNISTITKFQHLLVCRDAYWKIAGEEMGLGKPWEPDWKEKDGGYRYCIRNQSNKIVLSNEWLGENYILSFPIAEMRDVFYKNFNSLIEEVKELL